MIKSAQKGFEGYDPRIGVSLFYDVFLDGELLQDCFYFDTEKGVVICHKTDIDGNYVLNSARDGVEEISYSGIVEYKKVFK